jgi:hypothetical protein
MGIKVVYHDSVENLAKDLEVELKGIKELYTFYNNKIETTRGSHLQNPSASREKGRDKSGARSGKQEEIVGFRVLSNPSPEYELRILDEALSATQERIDALKRIKEELLPKLNKMSRVTVIYEDEVPIAFMYYDGK